MVLWLILIEENDSEEYKKELKCIQQIINPNNANDDRNKDLYFSNYARELFGSENAWGIVSAPLGNKENIKNFYNKVLKHFLEEYNNNDSQEERLNEYKVTRDAFIKQLNKVDEFKKEIEKVNSVFQDYYDAFYELSETERVYDNLNKIYKEKNKLLNKKLSNIKNIIKKDKYLKAFNNDKQTTNMLKTPLLVLLFEIIKLKFQKKKQGKLKSKKKNKIDLIKTSMLKIKNNIKETDMDKMCLLDDDFFDNLKTENVEVSTDTHSLNPWFSERYNREREKLFLLAIKLNKKFIVASKSCYNNLELLAYYWKRKLNKSKKYIIFDRKDKEEMVPALFQTLFLFIPIVSSTFASVQNFFRDVKTAGTIGLLVVDEAGQARPQMALGALYRCRKAIIVGDPKQVEPVVTEDVLLLEKMYKDEELANYKDGKKMLSVQNFADMINIFGTYINEKSNEKEWIGCPLLVHRRCLSPMFDISNQLSYNGIMKKKTKAPKDEVIKKMLYKESRWIDVKGEEVGNKNHFVKKQGDNVCEMLEKFFENSSEPSIFIISPFKTIETCLKEHIEEYCKINPKTRIKYNYLKPRIGTVHKFQGKEADEVIVVLGCDNQGQSDGAIRWVSNNIVNVAVTRAKYRVYIIGDKDAWDKSLCVNTARIIIENNNSR